MASSIIQKANVSFKFLFRKRKFLNVTTKAFSDVIDAVSFLLCMLIFGIPKVLKHTSGYPK